MQENNVTVIHRAIQFQSPMLPVAGTCDPPAAIN